MGHVKCVYNKSSGIIPSSRHHQKAQSRHITLDYDLFPNTLAPTPNPGAQLSHSIRLPIPLSGDNISLYQRLAGKFNSKPPADRSYSFYDSTYDRPTRSRSQPYRNASLAGRASDSSM